MLKEEVLFANDAFYLAFSAGDLAAMDQLWADRPDVVCLHPGWPALSDRDAVMESWARILGNPQQPSVTARTIRTVDLGSAMLVVCYECMEDTVLVASNLFEAGERGPRLVMHQSGLCADPPDLPTPERADVQ